MTAVSSTGEEGDRRHQPEDAGKAVEREAREPVDEDREPHQHRDRVGDAEVQPFGHDDAPIEQHPVEHQGHWHQDDLETRIVARPGNPGGNRPGSAKSRARKQEPAGGGAKYKSKSGISVPLPPLPTSFTIPHARPPSRNACLPS
jgi:hypothetical protein